MSTSPSPSLATRDPLVHAQAALQSVRAAQPAWAALSVAERAAKLRAAQRTILQRSDELAELISRETRKPLAEAYSSEVVGVGDLFGYWCDHGPELLKPRKGKVPTLEMPKKQAWIERAPRGVVACISPWNYPVALPMRTLLPALLAGNGVVLKPSEVTPRTGVWLVEQLAQALGPVVGVLGGDGAVGAALIEAGPDMVVFTGSTATGRKVAVACAQRGIPCELELGGKDCAVVLQDADLDRAAAGIAWGILTNAGQNCSGIERVAVHKDIEGRFVPKLVAALQRAAADVPELVTPQQRQVVERHVQDALARGATLLTGALTAPDQPLPPLLIGDVPSDAPVWCDESFGPLAVLAVGGDDHDLVRLANDSRYGLGASVWTRDLERGKRLASQLRTGMVWVNNHSFSAAVPDLPWVGLGDSGTGVTNSPEALMHLTRPKLVMVDGNTELEAWWYPYGERMTELMKVVVARQLSGGVAATLRTLGALKARMAELRSNKGN